MKPTPHDQRILNIIQARWNAARGKTTITLPVSAERAQKLKWDFPAGVFHDPEHGTEES